MTVEENLANTTSTLIQNFAEPTVEFLWEENNQLTFSALSQCIILSCIMLNFHSFKLHKIKSPYQFVSESNVKIFRNHRHSSNKFILFSDTTFPSVNRSSLLNLDYKEVEYREQRSKYPFIIISSLLDDPIHSADPENWKYSSDLSSSILLFVAHASGEVKLGYVYNVSGRHARYNIRMATFPVATNELSSSNILLSFWERIQSRTRFESENKDTDTDLTCVPKSLSLVTLNFDDETCVFRTTYCKLRNCSRKTCCDTIYSHSIILEQSGQLGNVGNRSSTLIAVWMLSLFLFRQFYGSSLYSFLTTNNEPKDYPKNIHEALARSDFDFICSHAFENRLYSEGFNLTRELFNFYVSILSRSYFTIPESGQDFETLTQQNASHGKETHVYSRIYNNTYENSGSLLTAMLIAYLRITYRSIVFNRFVYICEPDCMDGLGFFGQTKLVHKTVKDHPLLTYHQFWFQDRPSFQSFRFAKFLSSFVKSGFYELEVSRCKKLRHVKRLQKLEGSKKRGWSNGSLFSYAFLDALAKQRAQKENVEESTKIVALKGTFILMEVLVLVCVIIFLVELRIPKR
ncbi:unnamed protein product [Orchesella dallaii]|uniref:Uncharacterized protein n=1 Tax=Orchesella dallaii TaxID=48710 RepID=A0ABP1RGQ3_9HEXA